MVGNKLTTYIKLGAIIILVVVPPLAAYIGINRYLNNKYTALISTEVAPLDSKITIDGNTVSVGTTRVEPGKHTVSYSHEGFETITVKPNLQKGEYIYTGQILRSNNDATRNWYAQHADQARLVESISGKQHDALVALLFKKYPIINVLPYTAPQFEYRVDYGNDPADVEKIVLYVKIFSYNTDLAKQHASEWLTLNGVDVTKIQIVYTVDTA